MEAPKRDITVFMMSCIFLMVIVQIVLLTTLILGWEESEHGENVGLIFANSVLLLIIIITTSITIAIKRSQRKELARIAARPPNNPQVNHYVNNPITLDRYSITNNSNPTTNNEPELKTSLIPYTGEKSGKVCMICKLEIRKGQKIMQCKECLSVFHKEHIEEWLETNKDCPVCNIIISKRN